ncbi:MAG: hypothetical protein PVF83_11225 [Anaerolineales bacterium]|jgi:hypothetical protein
MDSLTVILVILSAIVFTWVGYFIGNFFPLRRKNKSGIQGEILHIESESEPSILQKLSEIFQREKEEDPQEIEQTPRQIEDRSLKENETPLRKIKEMTHIWYDKLDRKLYAEFDGEGVDLDKRLTPDQHSRLSFLLLDLQDKIGISAALRSVIQEREGNAFPEKDEDEVVQQPFNPVKSFLHYIQSDVPKLEDKVDSIPIQINEILQKKLKGSDYEKHGISIGEWPDRGVVFIVGVDIYSDIDDIPDPNIRYLIQAAVREWDSRENED